MENATRPIKVRCCESCRVSHQKCDGNFPACRNCQRLGRRCIRQRGVRFRAERPKRNGFPRHQIWLQYPSRVDFVDETKGVAQEIEWEHSGPSLPHEEETKDSHIDVIREETPEPGTSCGTSLPVYPPPSNNLPEEILPSPPSIPVTSPLSVSATTSPTSYILPFQPQCLSWNKALSQNPGSEVSWPLSDSQEATLLHHFVTKVSRFFDFCDRGRHFAIEVPQRARSCRTLFNAVLALSARHLSRISDFDPYASDRYYQECLKTLIPSLGDHNAAMDDNLLVATVILRLLEELDVPVVGSDLQGHLIGTQSFIRAHELNPMGEGLREAAYWAGLRQEIYISLALQRAPNIKPSSRRLLIQEPLLVSADDCTWASQAVLHCADVLDFAFGSDEQSRSAILYKRLEEYNQRWRDCRPASFDPYFSEFREGEPFPDLRFHTDWHVMGYQYLELAHILLVVYDPSVPRVGPAYRRAVRLLDENVKRDIRTLCGIGLSNPSTPPAILIACMALNLCGDRFLDPQDQEALLSILIQTETLHGWPTTSIQRSLKDAWA